MVEAGKPSKNRVTKLQFPAVTFLRWPRKVYTKVLCAKSPEVHQQNNNSNFQAELELKNFSYESVAGYD